MFVMVFLLMYMPARFMLDFLRVSDVRYLALTPAQWGAAVALLVLPVVYFATRQHAESSRT